MIDAQMEQQTENSINDYEPKWAGFWVRVLATIIDGLVIIPLFLLNFYNLLILKDYTLALGVITAMTIYKPLMEFKYGATLGKMALNLKVVNYEYNSITFSQAIIRYIPWLIGTSLAFYSSSIIYQNPDFINASNFVEVTNIQGQTIPTSITLLYYLIMLVSCIAVVFSSKKQGVHDTLASTYCIKNAEFQN